MAPGQGRPLGLQEVWLEGSGPARTALGWGWQASGVQGADLGAREHGRLMGHWEGPGARWHDAPAPLGKGGWGGARA